jgi:predicted RNase H-like HicB family nuclease
MSFASSPVRKALPTLNNELRGTRHEFEWRFNQRDNPYLFRDTLVRLLNSPKMAYVPDLPGCITTGRTPEEIERYIREAIELHLEGLREEGEPIPEPHTTVAYVDL